MDLSAPTICGPGFAFQVQHLSFFNLYLSCDKKRTKIDKKKPGLANLKKFYIAPFAKSRNVEKNSERRLLDGSF